MISKLKSPGAALIIIGSALFLYILSRAFLVSFTHDEGLTVMEYATQPWSVINNLNWTNNHLLNTWLCRLNLDWFGASEISFRWPNVFAGLLYIVFAAKLVRKIFADSWFGVFTFIILLCNTFLIDFFGLCRGYGLSMGLLMTGLYYFYRYIETRQLWYYGIALTAFGFALVANYTMLNFFLLQSGFFLLHAGGHFFTEKMSWKKKTVNFLLYAFYCIMTYFFTAWFIKLMLKMREAGNFNFGGDDGFWKNTVHSLIEFSSGPIVRQANLFYIVLTVLALVLFAGAGVFILFNVRKQKFTPLNWFAIFLFLVLFGCGAAIWLQHLLMNVPFSSDRAGLYFYLLFPLLIAICFFTAGSLQRTRRILALVFFTFPVISFFISLNLYRTLLWPFNANTKEGFGLLINDSKNYQDERSHKQVAVTFLEYPVYNYYLYKEKVTWLNFVSWDEAGFNFEADYVVRLDSIEEVPKGNYKILWAKDGKTIYRKDPLLKIVELKELPVNDYEAEDGRPKAPGFSGFAGLINPTNIFSSGICDTIKDTLPAGCVMHCHAKIWAESIHTQTRLVIDIARKQEPARIWKAYWVSWYLHEDKQWQDFDFWCVPGIDVLPGEVVYIYFLNEGKTDVRIDNFAVRYLARIPR
ncbi:hypothetical protein BH11BAC7_BH11BAC7_00210 [soil metagenome]